MSRQDDEEARIRGNFLVIFMADVAAGRKRTVSDYQALFPPKWAGAIADEFAVATAGASDQRVSDSPAPPKATHPEVGKPFRHFLLIKKLGEGGQGVVFYALDLNEQKFVAVKVFTVRGNPPEDWVKRFKREAQTLDAIRHPGVCKVHEAALEMDPPHLAMEFIEGRTLEDIMRQSCPPTADCIEAHCMRMASIIERVARILHIAHDNGVVHRDIKPANIMVTVDDRVVVLDFGLARLLDASTLTEEGAAVGTTFYMSPEQARGEPVDGRSDVFSLGGTLYEAITGRHPFPGSTAGAVLARITEFREPPRMGLGVSDDLETCVRVALSKSLEYRYASANEFAEDLGRVVSGYRPQGRLPTLLGRARIAFRRDPRLFTVIAIATVVLSVFAAIMTRVVDSYSRELEASSHRENSAKADRALIAVESAFDRGAYAAAIHEVDAAMAETPGLTMPDLIILRVQSTALLRLPATRDLMEDARRRDLPRRAAVRLQLIELDFNEDRSIDERSLVLEEIANDAAVEDFDREYARALAVRDPRDRIRALQGVVRRYPRHVSAEWSLLRLVVAEQRYTEVAEVANSLRTKRPEDKRVEIARAWAMFCTGKRGEAEAVLQALDESTSGVAGAATLNLFDAIASLQEAFAGSTEPPSIPAAWRFVRSLDAVRSGVVQAAGFDPVFAPIIGANIERLMKVINSWLFNQPWKKGPTMIPGIDSMIETVPEGWFFILRARARLEQVAIRMRELESEMKDGAKDEMLRNETAVIVRAAIEDFRQARQHGSMFPSTAHSALYRETQLLLSLLQLPKDQWSSDLVPRVLECVESLIRDEQTSIDQLETACIEAPKTIPAEFVRPLVDAWIRRAPESRKALECRAELEARGGNWLLSLDTAEALLAKRPDDPTILAIRDRAISELKKRIGN